ncbi:MAG: SLC13 family permease [Oscillospiraceae bacterium]
MSTRRRTALIIIGPVIFALLVLLFSDVLTMRGAQAIGLLLWMIFWWVTRPVSIAITALLPLAVNALFTIIPTQLAAAQYASDCVILLFGAGLLTLPWGKCGLDRRVALKALSIIGPSMRSQVVVWFLASVVISTVIPNIVCCALFTKLALAMLNAVGYDDISKCEAATPILLAICWGTVIGSVATPLGGAQNIILVNIFEEYTGQELMFVDWAVAMFPYFIVGTLVVLAGMLLIPSKIKRLEGTREYFAGRYSELGTMKRDEKICAVLFVIAVVVSFARPLFAKILPSLSPAFCFLILGFLGFFITNSEHSPMLTWDVVHKGTMWDLLCLVGGGMALGMVVSESGITGIALDMLMDLSIDGGLATIVVLVIGARILAECSDSTTAAAVMVPIAFEFATKLGLNPIPYIFIVAMGYSGEFVLPLGVRAITVASGLDPKKMMKYGLPFTVVTSVIVIFFGYFLMQVWPPFSTFFTMS